MKLNKLPVLVRTEVTAAAARGVSMPEVYNRALVVLDECIEELSFAKLKTVEISVEGLAAWAKATADVKLTEKARELKFRARRTANYIAERLVKQRRAAFVARGGVTEGGNVPRGEPEEGGITSVLRGAGYPSTECIKIRDASAVPDEPKFAQMNSFQLRREARALRGNTRGGRSAVYSFTFSFPGTPFVHLHWFRNNGARGLARQLTDPAEAEKAREKTTLVRAWCDEFLKSLPRNVSKGKTS